MKQRSKLTVRLALAFTLSTAATALVCVVALVDLVNVSKRTNFVVSRQMEVLRDAAAFDALMYQKGFVADYMLTGDRVWLRKLESSRAEFARWVDDVRSKLAPTESEVLDKIVATNLAYDRARSEAVALFDAGKPEQAKAMLPGYHVHIDRLVNLAQEFSRIGRREAQDALLIAESSIRRLAHLLVATSVMGALLSVVVGYMWARRIARPMYNLQLQVASAAQKTLIKIAPEAGEFDGLAGQIAALVTKVEESDAALVEQRRRLVQSEKMSAVGELAAKLGHEILNPLAGIKAAAQLMEMEASAAELSATGIRDTVRALGTETTRIEQLIRRLIGYARPLAPVIEACSVRRLVDAARESVASQLPLSNSQTLIEEQPNLPPLEVDPLLMTQVFVNLLRNAAESMESGGVVLVRIFRATVDSVPSIQVEILDEGSGIKPEQMQRLFTPFHTTKVTGHGLGLATSRNIVLEHGGHIDAYNRKDRTGAIFRVSLPLLR
jgi:signal transduction histidine kinase